MTAYERSVARPGVSDEQWAVFQDWVVLEGPGATDVLYQLPPFWHDGKDDELVQFVVRVVTATNCAVYLESALFPEGPWDACSGLSATTTVQMSNAPGASDLLNRFVRWRVAASGGGWVACFKIDRLRVRYRGGRVR